MYEIPEVGIRCAIRDFDYPLSDSSIGYKNDDGYCYVVCTENEVTLYTWQDFLDLCNGYEDLATQLFNLCNWQHPETLIDEWRNENWKENYDTLTEDEYNRMFPNIEE